MPYNIFAEDKSRNYPSSGSVPSSSMTYTMDELENGKGSVNSPASGSSTLVNNNQVNSGGSVKSPLVTKAIPTVDPSSPSSGIDALSQMYTSPEREEELRKSSVNKQRVLALADALRHIGNIYHTTKYSPAQIFNSPVMEERNRYLQEKAIRDANNYKFQSYQQAKAAQEAKIRQAERDFEYKVNKDARDYELNRQKTDSQLKTDEVRRKEYEIDAQRKQSDLEYLPTKRELERKNTESMIESRKDASARGWANVGLARQRLALGWANHNLSRSRSSSRVLSADKNKDYVYAPSGATYSFPKGTFTGVKGKANINTIYNQMLKKGLVPDPSDSTKLDLEYGITKLSDDDKLAFIMEAASTSAGHDDFVYAANRLGYKYEGGMSDEYSREIFKEANRQKARKSAPKAPPKSSVSAGTKPSATKAGASSNNNRQGAFSGFSIHNK